MRLRFQRAIYRWDFARDGEALEVEVNGPITVGEMPLAIRRRSRPGPGLCVRQLRRRRAGCWAFAHRAGRLATRGRAFYLYYPSRKLLPAGLRAFVDMLHEHPPR